MLGFVSIDFTWTCISFCVFYTSCICFFLYMAHEDRTQYLMTMLTMFWFVSYVFFLLCFHPVSVDLTCSTEVSIAPWALSPSIPPSRSTDSEKHVQRLLVKFVCWSGFQENVSPVGSPHPTWPLMRRWKSAWDLDRGCNKRENAGRPQTFALHPHFLNEPHAIHIWYSQFSVHMQISMFANIRFCCWSAVSGHHTKHKNNQSDLKKKTQFGVFLTKNRKKKCFLTVVFSSDFCRSDHLYWNGKYTERIG